jgi:hypothetical protein
MQVITHRGSPIFTPHRISHGHPPTREKGREEDNHGKAKEKDKVIGKKKGRGREKEKEQPQTQVTSNNHSVQGQEVATLIPLPTPTPTLANGMMVSHQRCVSNVNMQGRNSTTIIAGARKRHCAKWARQTSRIYKNRDVRDPPEQALQMSVSFHSTGQSTC